MTSREAGALVSFLGTQLQIAGSLICLGLGLLLRRGVRDRPWLDWWAWSFGCVALAVGAIGVRYLVLPLLPIDVARLDESLTVAILYAVYSGGKLLSLFCLLAGTWLFVRREPIPPVGLRSALALIVGVAVLFIFAPTRLNQLVAWQGGLAMPVFLICGALLSSLPAARATRGSRLLATVCFLLAALWTLYTPAFMSVPDSGGSAAPGFFAWLAGHNSFIDTLFEFLLCFGMILAVLDDVFREAEEARAARLGLVAASEARLGEIIRAASDGIVLLDTDRRVAHANPAALEILASPEQELIGQPFDRFLTGSSDLLWAAAGTRGPATARVIEGRRGTGDRFPMELSLRGIGDGTPTGYVLILRDLTERTRLEEERERMQLQLAQAARLETIGRMVSGVAHELNNPLTAILAFAQDLLSQARGDEDKDALNTIVQQAQRCRAIVQDLLTFARTKREDRQSVAVKEVVDRVLPVFERQGPAAGIVIETDIAETLPPLHANPPAIEQVLTNLLSNAFQAIGERGRVLVSARVEEEWLAIAVEDDGPGIPPDVLPRLFEPFFTTKDPGQGTGLGLSVSHGIIDQHGGTLRAENRSGPGERGARFIIKLPFVDRRSLRRGGIELPPSDVASRPSEPGAKRRVLLVDDEGPIRVAIRRFLERRGWAVEEARDGRDALDLLGLDGVGPSRVERYDAVVTDLRMPGINGIEIHDRLAALGPEAVERLVIISGDTASAEVAGFVARLKQPLVQKPFDMRTLAELLDRIAPPEPAAERS